MAPMKLLPRVVAATALASAVVAGVGLWPRDRAPERVEVERPVEVVPLLGAGGTLYVVAQQHPQASDAGPGTPDRPWRTIGRAAQQMQPGDAVRIHAGTYRETVAPPRGGTGPAARITYAAAPGEAVVVTGADRVADGWQAAGAGRWRRTWTWGPMPAYADGDPAFRRELAVADGTVLRPVAQASDLVPGTMRVEGPDTAPTAITVHLPPGVGTDDLEVAVRQHLFWPVGATPFVPCGDASQPSWLRVVGITFRHAANRAQWGAVCAGASDGLLEDVTVEWTIGMGIDTSGRDHVFRRVASSDHGQMGWGGASVRLWMEDTEGSRNNWRGHDPFWEAGGGKWRETRESVWRRHLAEGNDGPGLWLDGDNHANTIEGGLFVGNQIAGVMLELATTGTLVQHCVLAGTRMRAWSGAGVLSQAASDNVLLHNTVVGNEGSGVWLRLDPEGRAPDARTRIEANWIVGNATHAAEARDLAIHAPTAAVLAGHTFWSNVYGRRTGDALWRSTFHVLVAPVSGAAVVDLRTNDPQAWAAAAREPGARVVDPGTSPAAGWPLLADRALPRAGAPSAPAVRGLHVGADPEQVRPAGPGRVSRGSAEGRR